MENLNKGIFLDPSYEVFYKNKLFDLGDGILNRDDQLLSMSELKKNIELCGKTLLTADYLIERRTNFEVNSYYSLGLLGFRKLLNRADINFKGFLILEPPLVAPHLYKILPELTSIFDQVYMHNIEGDGYSLKNVDVLKLRKLFIDQPWSDTIDKYWLNQDRSLKVVAISGHHNPRFRRPEFYTLRIKAMLELSKFDAIDLYGKGWDKVFSKQILWPFFIKNRRAIMSIYKGPCLSKHEVLSLYRYALCLENTPMKGYVTEKIFDCFYAGTVPLYLGAPDVENYIPSKCYVDLTKFSSWKEVWTYIGRISDSQWHDMREEAKSFLKNVGTDKYFRSYEKIIK